VYLAETGDGEQAVLKRITVPDEEKLVPVMREVQVMVRGAGRTRFGVGVIWNFAVRSLPLTERNSRL
jgi:hypothetical protein